MDARLKDLRGQLKDLQKQFDKSENDLKVIRPPPATNYVCFDISHFSSICSGILSAFFYFTQEQ